MEQLVIYTDGGSRGNPGAAAAGIFIPQTGTRIGVWLGDDKTNNDAEYLALVYGLTHLLTEVVEKLTVEARTGFHIEVRADSQLMVKQMRGEYAVHSPTLQKLWERAQDIAVLFPNEVTYTYVPRAQNADADAIANEIMDRVAAGEKIECFVPMIL